MGGDRMNGYELSMLLMLPATMLIAVLVIFGIIVPRGIKAINHDYYRRWIEADEHRKANGIPPHWTDEEKAAWRAWMGE
jgi:hypothetical protein